MKIVIVDNQTNANSMVRIDDQTRVCDLHKMIESRNTCDMKQNECVEINLVHRGKFLRSDNKETLSEFFSAQQSVVLHQTIIRSTCKPHFKVINVGEDIILFIIQ